jgi:hypothetical protein
MPKAWAESSPPTGPWRLIEPLEIAQAVWTSWLNDPSHLDATGHPTLDRIHWYIPEELVEEVDAVVNTRGGTEKVREMYKEVHWKGMVTKLKEAGVVKD